MDATPPFNSLRSGDAGETEPTSFARKPRKLLPGTLLDGYLLGHVAEATLRGLGMFVMLLLFFAVITATRRLLDNSLGLGGAMQLIVYQLPRIFLFTLPMSILYGVLHAFAELSNRGEIIGMWGGGMSFRRMLVPPLVWASLLAISAFWVQENIVPGAEQAKDKVLASQIENSTLVQDDIDFTDERPDGSSVRITASEYNAKRKTLRKPVVQRYNAKRQFEDEIEADLATWNPATGKWRFDNPRIYNRVNSRDAGEAQTLLNSGTSMEFEAPNPSKLGKPALTRRENLLKHNFEFVSIPDLQAWRVVAAGEAVRPNIKKSERDKWQREVLGATFGIHDKIATPLICVALVLIGGPLGLRPQRSAGGFSLGLSLIILMLYYVVWTWATQVGKQGVANPLLMAYLPLALTLAAGLALTWKKVR